MPTAADHQTQYLPDGSSVRYTVRTEQAAVASIFAADLAGRLRRASRLFTRADADRSLAAYRSYAPGADDHRSTDRYDLPGGEVTVAIEASGRASHGYLRYLVRGAVAYTHVLDVEADRAGPLAALLLAVGGLLVAVGVPFLATPFLGAGAIVGAYVGLYWLSAKGYPLSLSRTPVPAGPDG